MNICCGKLPFSLGKHSQEQLGFQIEPGTLEKAEDERRIPSAAGVASWTGEKTGEGKWDKGG